jgi:hypothetical protein
MDKWSEKELNWYLERLAKNDTREIALTLSNVAQIGREPKPQPVPTGNAEVITYLEQLVEEDRRMCIVDFRISYTFGELRWLAARVLACEYAYQGIEEPIILKDVVQPIRGYKYAKSDLYRKIEDINLQGLVPNRTIEELIQQGLVPTKTEIIKPQDYAVCCSKEAVEARRRNQETKE